jgi:hypothetical protein
MLDIWQNRGLWLEDLLQQWAEAGPGRDRYRSALREADWCLTEWFQFHEQPRTRLLKVVGQVVTSNIAIARAPHRDPAADGGAYAALVNGHGVGAPRGLVGAG